MEIMKVKSTITKIKILLEELNSRFELAEERISKLKDRLIKIIQSKLREKKRRKMNSLRKIWDKYV